MSEQVYRRFSEMLANATRREQLTTYHIITFLIIRYTMELRLGLRPTNSRSIKNQVNRFRQRVHEQENLTVHERRNIESRLNTLNQVANNRRRLNAPASPAHSST